MRSIALAIGLVGCGAGASSSSTVPLADLTRPPSRAEPFPRALRAQAKTALAAYDDGPGASILVIRDGEPLLLESVGYATLEARVPVTPETTFRLSSMTKQFTAMAMLLLETRGEISLDDTLFDSLPRMPEWTRQVTLRHLVHHTGGLPDYTCPPGRSAQDPMTDADVLEQVRKATGPIFVPGGYFSYSNTGYSVLASVIEEKTGVRYAEYLRREVLEPLGMTASYVLDPHDPARAWPEPRARGYTNANGAIALDDQQCDTGVLGDGNLYSNVLDLARWDASLYHSPLVDDDALQRYFTSGTPSGQAYAFGWHVGTLFGVRVYDHGGSTGGFRSHIERFPDLHTTIVMLTNRLDDELTPTSHAVPAIRRLVLFPFIDRHGQPIETDEHTVRLDADRDRRASPADTLVEVDEHGWLLAATVRGERYDRAAFSAEERYALECAFRAGRARVEER